MPGRSIGDLRATEARKPVPERGSVPVRSLLEKQGGAFAELQQSRAGAEEISMQDKNSRQGDKTHEQHLRMLERKPDLDDSGSGSMSENTSEVWRTREARAPTHQESEHHKSNDSGQSGHKPQKHNRAEEKQQGE